MNDYQYNDLLQRISDLERRLQCVGDDVGISVEQTPGGQIIRNLQELPPEVEAEASPDYISVSYDSGTEKFTVTITALPLVTIDYGAAVSYTNYDEITATYKFDLPAGNVNLDLYAEPSPTSSLNTPNIRWITAANLAGSDTTTKAAESSVTYGIHLARFVLRTDGTFGETFDRTGYAPIYVARNESRPVFYVNTSTRRIWIGGYWNDYQKQTISTSLAYTEPLNEQIILGFKTNSTSYTLDLYSNRLTYYTYVVVGQVTINSNNNATQCVMFERHSPGIMGWSGSFVAHDNKTVYVENGLIRLKVT